LDCDIGIGVGTATGCRGDNAQKGEYDEDGGSYPAHLLSLPQGRRNVDRLLAVMQTMPLRC
jgi:hypothetical protein